MSESAPARQRSPWFYVLLGCGGLALVLLAACFASGAFLFSSGKNMVAGVSDPETKKKNALDQLGVIPDGYRVEASIVAPLGVARQTLLTDQAAPEDDAGGLGTGFPLTGHFFLLKTQMMDKTQVDAAREFFSGKTSDTSALRAVGVNLDERSVIKRSEVAFDGKKAHLLVTRSAVGVQGDPAGLSAVLLFDCPDNGFHLASWIQRDPTPEKKNDELDLGGTVADEAELAKFLKPLRVCGK